MGADPAGHSGYETFEHTADVGLLVRGTGVKDLFEQAAAGLISLMLDPAAVRAERTVRVAVRAEEPEELLVAWLSEILFALDADGFAPAQARVCELKEGELRGELLGEDLDPERHEVRCHVKAVTYHGLEIRHLGDHCEVRIIFDV